jgi:hypothetical protein
MLITIDINSELDFTESYLISALRMFPNIEIFDGADDPYFPCYNKHIDFDHDFYVKVKKTDYEELREIISIITRNLEDATEEAENFLGEVIEDSFNVSIYKTHEIDFQGYKEHKEELEREEKLKQKALKGTFRKSL